MKKKELEFRDFQSNYKLLGCNAAALPPSVLWVKSQYFAEFFDFLFLSLYISVHSKKKDLIAIQFLGKDLRYSKQKMALFLKKQS